MAFLTSSDPIQQNRDVVTCGVQSFLRQSLDSIVQHYADHLETIGREMTIDQANVASALVAAKVQQHIAQFGFMLSDVEQLPSSDKAA